MEIYDINGVLEFDVEINERTKLRQTLKGEDKISCVFTSLQYLDITIGHYVEFEGTQYTVQSEPSVKKARTNEYSYSVDFVSPKHLWQKAMMVLDGKTEYYLFGTLADHLNHILSNVNRVLGTFYTITIPVWTETQNISYENVNCLEALDSVIQLFGKEYTVVGSTLVAVDKVGVDSSSFSFQFKNGLRGITRKKLNKNELTTRLYPLGGSRNITSAYGSKRLQIDPIERNVDLYGVWESVKVFDDVYPHRTGTVSSLGADIFTFADNSMPFDLNANGVLIAGSLAKITFNTGDLTGYEFELISYTDSSKTFVLKSYDDSNGLVLPSDTLKPSIGDTYVLHGINMPLEYIGIAEQELRDKADEYMESASYPTVVYEIKPDPTFIRENLITIGLGDTITVFDAEMNVQIETRVTELSKAIVDPDIYELKVGNKTTEGFIREISEKTASIGTKLSTEVETLNKTINHLKKQTEVIAVPTDDSLVGLEKLKPETKGLPYMISRLKIYPNYEDLANRVFLEESQFVHFTIETTVRIWTIPEQLVQVNDNAKMYFIYAKCNKGDNEGSYVISELAYLTDNGSDEYFFLLGVLSPVQEDGLRVLNAMFVGGGSTSVNNITVTEGGDMTGEEISQVLYDEPDTNRLTDALFSKLQGLGSGGTTLMEIPYQSTFTLKADGSTEGVLSKNDVIIIRWANDQIYWLQYNGVGDKAFLASYTILNRIKINNLYP